MSYGLTDLLEVEKAAQFAGLDRDRQRLGLASLGGSHLAGGLKSHHLAADLGISSVVRMAMRLSQSLYSFLSHSSD